MKQRIIIILLFIQLIIFAGSCLKDAPETFPEDFIWNPEFAFPVTQDTLGMNEESGFDMRLLDINPLTGYPYWVELIGIPMEGNASFNLSSIIHNMEEVNRAMFRINAYNGFPAEAQLQTYFEESDGYRRDSLFLEEPMLIAPGKVNKDGITVTPTYTKQDVVFDRDRLNNLVNVVSISFKMIILNADLDSLLIPNYENYSITIDLAAMLDITLTI